MHDGPVLMIAQIKLLRKGLSGRWGSGVSVEDGVVVDFFAAGRSFGGDGGARFLHDLAEGVEENKSCVTSV